MMADDLDLTLETSRKKGKDRKDRTALIVALLVVTATATVADLVIRLGAGRSGEDPAALERLALKLENRGLSGAAARTWMEYLEVASPGKDERARIWYRVGRMREREGDCESALAAYYRSEQTADLPDLEGDISMAAQRCLTRLAKFSALRSEIAERTSLDSGSGPGSEVLAEIGPEKITRDRLEAMIEAEVDAQVALASAELPEDEVRARKEKLLDEVMRDADLRQWLDKLVAEELLYRYAMEEKLYEDPEIEEMSRHMERKLLASRVLAREYAKSVSVSEDEIEAWYEANGAKLASGTDGGDDGIPPLDEVRDRAYAAVRLEKERAVQKALLEKLTERYDVVIHAPKPGDGNGEGEK